MKFCPEIKENVSVLICIGCKHANECKKSAKKEEDGKQTPAAKD